MKATKPLLTTAIVTFFAVIEGVAQTSTTTTTTTQYVPTTSVVGARVVATQGEEVGQISDVVLDQQSGCMAYVVLSVDQNGTRKTVAAPWSVLRSGTDSHTFTIQVDREKIFNAPVWESTRIDEYSRTDWISNVYSYYGVQPQAGVNIRTHAVPRRDVTNESEETQRSTQTKERRTEGTNPDTLTRPPRGPEATRAHTSAANDSRDESERSRSESRRGEDRKTDRQIRNEEAPAESQDRSQEQPPSQRRANGDDSRQHGQQREDMTQQQRPEGTEPVPGARQSNPEPAASRNPTKERERAASPQPGRERRPSGQDANAKPSPTP